MEGNKMDIETEVNKLGTEDENLAEVVGELGLTDQQVVDIAARERFSMASSYQILATRLTTVRASKKANEAVGNLEAAKGYEKQEADMTRDMNHCLRGIKAIDRLNLGAKARMQAMGK